VFTVIGFGVAFPLAIAAEMLTVWVTLEVIYDHDVHVVLMGLDGLAVMLAFMALAVGYMLRDA
jgi:hypothetical protein